MIPRLAPLVLAALSVAACEKAEQIPAREVDAPPLPPVSVKRRPPETATVAEAQGGLAAKVGQTLPDAWLDVPAAGKVGLDLAHSRVRVQGPSAVRFHAVDGALLAVRQGRLHWSRPPGQGGRTRAWLATPAAVLSAHGPLELVVQVRADGATYAAVVSGATELSTGEVDMTAPDRPRAVRRTLQAPTAVVIDRSGTVSPVPAPPARVERAAEAADAALQSLQTVEPVDLWGPLDTVLATITAERATGKQLQIERAGSPSTAGTVSPVQKKLVKHAQRLMLWRRVLLARLGRYVAAADDGQADSSRAITRGLEVLRP